ncbi:hypothetical protein [Halobacillus sp. A5]|uniref:hypothetical protein n=1 Tax=Halobacillus sp. A5 TaxID=2880263 RepID=UPI0020A6D39A|nr:hypothetical protein [Halobacillus sp. A5]MCP3027511.1 hypothetical protein [Halobacillus sp. A5]
MRKKQNRNKDDLFADKSLEFIAAILILCGQLSVDRVLISRDGEVELRMIGEFRSPKNPQVDELQRFLKNNGDMSIDHVIEAFKQKLND